MNTLSHTVGERGEIRLRQRLELDALCPASHNGRMAKHTPLPPVARLHELFIYDPENGTLTRKIATPGHRAGTPAGNVRQPDNRMRVNADCKSYKFHRVCWAMHNGSDPGEFEVDHIDGDPMNNRISNLRLANRSQNQSNNPASKRNTTGFKGVTEIDRPEGFRATIIVGGKMKYGPLRATREGTSGDHDAILAKFDPSKGFPPAEKARGSVRIKPSRGFKAQIMVNYKGIAGPLRQTAEEAYEDYRKMSAEHHGEFGNITSEENHNMEASLKEMIRR
jgi:hypothetical protein